MSDMPEEPEELRALDLPADLGPTILAVKRYVYDEHGTRKGMVIEMPDRPEQNIHLQTGDQVTIRFTVDTMDSGFPESMVARITELTQALLFARNQIRAGKPWDEFCEQMITVALRDSF